MQPTLFDLPEPIETPEPLPVYAVNIADLTMLAQDATFVTRLMLRDFCDEASPPVMVRKDLFDEDAVLLDGIATQDRVRLEALIDLLMCSIGPRRIGRPIRCYRQGPRGGWKRIPKRERTITA